MEALTNPWVIGIGTTIIAGLILYYGFGIGKAKPRKQTSNHQEHPMPVSSHPVEERSRSNLLPEEIMGYLNGLPPFQRQSAAKNYEGITVSWEVTLLNVDTTPDGETYLLVYSKGELRHPIKCPVEDLARYPEVKIMKEGVQFRVEGHIDHVSDLGLITLRNCQFHF